MPDRAAVALAAAEGLRQRSGLRAWPTLRRDEAGLIEELKQSLGPDRFNQAFGMGSQLNRHQAVAIVRGESDVHTGAS
jgi:hypothetical protein